MSSIFNIVVVDDEQAMELLFHAFFDSEISSKKLKITYFNQASECLAYLKNGEKVDLVLSDINMPQMNGLELLELIKKHNVELPVYMISAYGSEEYFKKARDCGADGFFVKPFDFDEIKGLVGQMCQI